MKQKYTKLLWICGIVLLVIILAVAFYFIWYSANQGWKCTENGCEQVLNGKFQSKEICHNNCPGNLETYEDEGEAEDYENDDDEYDSWACTSEYKCVAAEGGDFTSKEACEKNCKQPVTYYYPYYYPQSLYPRYYVHRRPRYWSYQGFGRPIRHGGGRIHRRFELLK